MAALDIESLRPMGFKILLEIVLRNTRLRVGEIGFTFASRYGGESKASAREGLRFVAHILRLRLATLKGPGARGDSLVDGKRGEYPQLTVGIRDRVWSDRTGIDSEGAEPARQFQLARPES
jgi:hypothetical protein